MLLTQALTALTITSWVVLALIIGIGFARTVRRDGVLAALRRSLFWRAPLAVLAVAVVLSLLNRSLIFVMPQETAVVVSVLAPNGYRDRPLRSGLHVLAPLLEEVHRYPISWQTYTMSSTPAEGARAGDDSIIARTRDGQEVSFDCSIIFQIQPEQAVRIHIEWQNRYTEDFVRAVTRGIVRTIVSRYSAAEVNSDRRQNLESELQNELRTVFLDKGFVLDRFVLRNVAFSPEYATAIELKQVALEGIERSEHEADQIRRLADGRADEVRKKAEAEAEAIRIKAEAEAQALRQIAAALAGSPSLLQYRYIEKLAPSVRVMLVPNNAPYLLPLPDLNGAGDQGLAPASTVPAGATAPPAPATTATSTAGPAPTAAPTTTP